MSNPNLELSSDNKECIICLCNKYTHEKSIHYNDFYSDDSNDSDIDDSDIDDSDIYYSF